MNVAGIGVSAKTVTLVISRDEGAGNPRELKNTSQGHVTLSNRLRKANVSRVCLEATGLYHLDLALALDDVGLEVMVIPLLRTATADPTRCQAARRYRHTTDPAPETSSYTSHSSGSRYTSSCRPATSTSQISGIAKRA